MMFFRNHKVKVIEKDKEMADKDRLRRDSGRSSLRQSQSIASEDPNAGNSQEEEYEKDSFVVDEDESVPQHAKKKKDNKQKKTAKKSDKQQNMEDTNEQAKTKVDPVEHRESN